MVKERNCVIAGSEPGSAWAIAADIIARILAKSGYQAHILKRPGPTNPVAVGTAEADIGVAARRITLGAMYGDSTGQGTGHTNLRRIAYIDFPTRLAIAVRRATGITALDQIDERSYPLRLLVRIDRVVEKLFRMHGFSVTDIETWGGKIYRLTVPADEIRSGGRNPDAKHPGELVKGNRLDMIVAQCWNSLGEFGTLWRQASCFMDLKFIPLSEDVIEVLCEEFHYQREIIPASTFEGVDEDVPTIGDFSLAVYCRIETPSDLVYSLTKALDENSREFVRTRHQLSYNPKHSCVDDVIPLHEAALEYYRVKGLM